MAFMAATAEYPTKPYNCLPVGIMLTWLAILVFELDAMLLDEMAFRLKLLLLLLRLLTLLLMLMTRVMTPAAKEA